MNVLLMSGLGGNSDLLLVRKRKSRAAGSIVVLRGVCHLLQAESL